MRRSLGVLAAVLVVVSAFAAVADAAPADYGRVVINNSSAKGGVAPVVFDHWLHRAKYTCRLCHVDIGFGLKANATGITAADNAKGSTAAPATTGSWRWEGRSSSRHAVRTRRTSAATAAFQGKNVKPEHDFAAFTAKFRRTSSATASTGRRRPRTG